MDGANLCTNRQQTRAIFIERHLEWKTAIWLNQKEGHPNRCPFFFPFFNVVFFFFSVVTPVHPPRGATALCAHAWRVGCSDKCAPCKEIAVVEALRRKIKRCGAKKKEKREMYFFWYTRGSDGAGRTPRLWPLWFEAGGAGMSDRAGGTPTKKLSCGAGVAHHSFALCDALNPGVTEKVHFVPRVRKPQPTTKTKRTNSRKMTESKHWKIKQLNTGQRVHLKN